MAADALDTEYENGVADGARSTSGSRGLSLGVPIGLEVLVSSEEDIAAKLDRLATTLLAGVPRERLDVVRPDVPGAVGLERGAVTRDSKIASRLLNR